MEDSDAISICKFIRRGINNNAWDDQENLRYENYDIKQFQGTAFDSDYKCFLITDTATKQSVVAKITYKNEADILPLLATQGFNVPRIFVLLSMPPLDGKDYMMFEEYIPGDELYEAPSESWCITARDLAKIHARYLNGDNIGDISEQLRFVKQKQGEVKENIFTKKCDGVRNRNFVYRNLNSVRVIALARLERMPKTLCHGDMFPTNVVMNNATPYFIDWAECSIMPYAMDIARLTCLPIEKTGADMCTCSDAVLASYYEVISEKLKKSYTEFLLDVYAAQYVELGYIYTPRLGIQGQSYAYNRACNKAIEEKLMQIAEHFL